MVLADKIFYFLAFLALFSALGVILVKNPIHSVLLLILSFFCISGHYILLNAQFLAAVNIIVYAGAIMVLFLFTIMFLNLRGNVEPVRPLFAKLAAAISGGLLLVTLVGAIRGSSSAPKVNADNSQIGMVNNLGKVLFNEFLLPFELASVLFLAAMVGAVLLGKKEKKFVGQGTLVSSGPLSEQDKLEAASTGKLLG